MQLTQSKVFLMKNSSVVLSVEGVCKSYRLGAINHGLLYRDLQSWWARKMGREDPNAKLDLTIKNRDSKNGTVQVLDDVTFEVNRGEAIGIVGKNGAGKSTLLKILAKITSPTKGLIKYKGRIASLLEVGTGFHPDLTGRENIYLNGAILGMTKDEINSNVDEIIEFSGVGKYIDTPVKRYSSGMYVRLAFSVAAHLNVDILIIDEVLAVGDSEFQKKCLEKLESVAKGGGTIIFVSHNPIAIRRFCTRLIYLDGGRVKQVGPVDKVLSRYQEDSMLISAKTQIDESRALERRVAIVGFDVSKNKTSGLSVSVKLKSAENLKSAQIYINLLDLDGISVAFFDSSIDDGFCLDLTGEVLVHLKIDPSYTLPSGRYTFNIAVVYAGEWLDHVENISQIEWEYDDFFNSGRVPYHKSIFYPRHSWLIEKV